MVLMNSAGAAVAGQSQQDLLGKPLGDVVGPDTSMGLRTVFTRALMQGNGIKDIVPGVDGAGVPGFYENTVVPFGQDLVFATYRDVSESVEERERLLWLSEHDYLTGMPNRSKLQASLDECVSSCKKNKSFFGFVFIDIDYFKNVNDTYGHSVGDALDQLVTKTFLFVSTKVLFPASSDKLSQSVYEPSGALGENLRVWL